MNEPKWPELSGKLEDFFSFICPSVPLTDEQKRVFAWFDSNKGKRLIMERPRARFLADAALAKGVIDSVLSGNSNTLVANAPNPSVLAPIKMIIGEPDSVKELNGTWMYQWDGKSE